VDVLLRPLEDRLQRHAHLGGDRPCATDLAVFPFVRQFAAVEPAWFDEQPWPALQAWLAHWMQSPLFLACMARLPANTPMRFPALDSA
jgi:glutathione S-transferase